MYVTYPKGVIIIKKSISTLLTLTLMLCLCACNEPNSITEDKSNIQQSTNAQINNLAGSDSSKFLETSDIPTEPLTQVSADVATFSSLPYYKPDNIANYTSYKQVHPELSIDDIVTHVNIGLHTPFYSNIKTNAAPSDLLVLCNKYNSLGANYVPNDLVTMKEPYASKGQQMRKEAAEAFYQLSHAASLAGHKIMAVSTYRSYSYQNKIYNIYVSRDGQAKADTYTARAGTSEHQTGLAVDVSAGEITDYPKFGNTASYQWAKDNIHNYGFIIRYPEGKTHITGYMAEPWHFRYVGVETAKKVYESGLTYDEYYVRYIAE